jgi:hypothetical protein
MSTVKRKHTVTTVLAVFVLLVGMFALAVQVGADDVSVIVVPGGDVDALYAAVYDESGMPRDNVKIFLEPGVYALDTNSRPFDGRLVLGDSTSLESTLRMAVDDGGVPLFDDNFQPTILEEGAVIIGWGLAPDPFGEGIIEVGYKGRVEGLTVAGGIRPGIEVTSRGTISGVYSKEHSIGLRVRAASAEEGTRGTLQGNLSTGNFAGISILTNELDRFGDQAVSNAVVRAKLIRNASANNFVHNLAVFGGLGTDNNEFHVTVSGNVFRGGPPDTWNIVIIGGQDFYSPGGNNNSVKVALDGNLVADGRVGLAIVGGRLQHADAQSDPSIPLEQRQSSNNQVVVNVSDTSFQGYDGFHTIATSVIGSYADPDGNEAGGDHNTVKVLVDTEPSKPEDLDHLWSDG